MKLLLVSGRYGEDEVKLAADAALASALAGQGCAVRWLFPQRPGAHMPVAPGVRAEPVSSLAPPPTRVDDRLLDAALETRAAELCVEDLPDIVHQLDFGGSSSANMPWVAARLGATSLVSLDPGRTLCQRGDLVHSSGRSCDEWLDPARCWACTLGVRGDGDLPPLSRGLAWLLGGVPFAPWPGPDAFLNRVELLQGGLQAARRLLVRRAEHVEMLASIGLRRDHFEVVPEPDAASLRALYARLLEG